MLTSSQLKKVLKMQQAISGGISNRRSKKQLSSMLKRNTAHRKGKETAEKASLKRLREVKRLRMLDIRMWSNG